MSNTNKELNNVKLNVTFVPASIRENIVSGENISTSFGKLSKLFSDLKSIAWDGHPTVTQNDTTSSVSPNPEETFTVVDSVARNTEGHVTGVNTKTVKLPTGSGYVHPTYDSYSSGLYKVEVDELGHVSGATSVTKSDITALGIPSSNTLNTAGSTDTSSKIYLIGSTGQYSSSVTYSHDTVYVGTDGCLYSNSSKVLTEHPSITISTDSTSTASPTHGGTFTVIDTVTRDTNGHVTKVNTKTITLPAQYSHPTYTSKSSGLYKITVDTTGHVSATSSVTKSDIPSLDYVSSTTTRSANLILAGPSSGSATAPTFRSLVAADLPSSGATAGSYGPSANASPAHSGTFSVPYITINEKGQVTDASTKTITLPASANTDTKVNVTLGTTTKAYLLGTSTTPTSSATGVTAIADTGVYLDTTAGKLTATTFAGSLSGNASTATKLQTARTINGVSFDGSANISVPRNTKRIHRATGTEGSTGYVKIISIKVVGNYANHPVEFIVSQRARGPYHLYVQFNSVATTDPTLYEFKHYDPSRKGVNAYIVKSATSTWDIYVQKIESYDHIYVLDVLKADSDEGSSISITYTNTQVSSVPTTNQKKSTATIPIHTHSKLLYSGSGSSSITISGLSSSTYDLFTVVVKDSVTGYTHNIFCEKSVHTKYCIATTPDYNTSSSSTGMMTIGIGIALKTDTVEVATSKYIIQASSTSATATTHSRSFTILKVYGHTLT